MGRMRASSLSRLRSLRKSGRLFFDARRFAAALRPPEAPTNTTLAACRRRFVWLPRRDQSEQREARGRRVSPFPWRIARLRPSPSIVPARGVRIVPDRGRRRSAPTKSPCLPSRDPPPFRDPGGTTISNAHLRVVFAPFAGARIAEFGDGPAMRQPASGYCAMLPTPASARLGATLHRRRTRIRSRRAPLIVLTDVQQSRRAYQRRASRARTMRRICPGGGAIFHRTLDLERRQPRIGCRREVRSARSALDGAPWSRSRALRLRRAIDCSSHPTEDCARHPTRQYFGRASMASRRRRSRRYANDARRRVDYARLCATFGRTAARRLHRSATPARRVGCSTRNSRSSRGEVAEWQTQPPQKRPRQLMWVRLPPSP